MMRLPTSSLPTAGRGVGYVAAPRRLIAMQHRSAPSDAGAAFVSVSASIGLGAAPCARAAVVGSRRSRPAHRSAVRPQAFFGNLFKSDPSEATRKKYQARVDEINKLEPQMQQLSDAELHAKTAQFKQRVAGGVSLDSMLPEAFAVRMQHTFRGLRTQEPGNLFWGLTWLSCNAGGA